MSSRSALFAIAVFLVCSTVSVSGKPIPIQTFFEHPEFTDVTISPTGRYLALEGRNSAKPEQYLLDVIDLKTHKVISHYSLSDYKQVESLQWVDDDRLVFSTAEQSGTFDRPLSTGEVWTIKADGYGLRGLAGTGKSGGITMTYHYAWLLSILRGDPRHVLVGMSNFKGNDMIYRVSLLTGKQHKVAVSPLTDTADMLTDYGGNLRFVTGWNDKTYLPEARYRSADGDWKDLSNFLRNHVPFISAGPINLTPQGNHLYAILPDKDGTLGLFDVNLDKDKAELLYADPHYDLSSDFGDFYDFPVYSYDHKSFIGFSYTADLPKYIWLEPKAPKAMLIKGLQAAFPGNRVQITSSTRDGSTSIVLVSSDRNPGDYYLYKNGKVQLLFSRKPGIVPNQMSAMHPVSFKARDGLTIHGYLTLPPQIKMAAAHKLPLIIHPHGGPFGVRDYWDFDPEVQFLAHHGYAVLQVNYRGSGGYGPAFQAGGYRQWGGKMQDDLTDATHWAISQGIADPKRICIYGASYGGYAALEGVEKEPDLYECAVGYVGVYDLTLFAGQAHTLQGRSLGRFFKVAVGQDETALKSVSPVYNVNRIKAKLFIAYGGEDHTVDPENAEELKSALNKIGKPYELMYYPKEGHGYYKVDHQVAFYTKLIKFLDKNIGPDATVH